MSDAEERTMSIITPELVKKYYAATERHGLRQFVPSDCIETFVYNQDLDRTALGMLAAAEMILRHARATTSLNEGAAFLQVRAAHETSANAIIEAVGIDPKAWEKAREK